jgi:hypothetical protein
MHEHLGLNLATGFSTAVSGNVATQACGETGPNSGAQPDDQQILDPLLVELIALRARLVQLKAAQPSLGNQSAINQPKPPPIDCLAPPPVLHVDPEAVKQVRQAISTTKEADKKQPLPDIVPGFKASPLDAREYYLCLSNLIYISPHGHEWIGTLEPCPIASVPVLCTVSTICGPLLVAATSLVISVMCE